MNARHLNEKKFAQKRRSLIPLEILQRLLKRAKFLTGFTLLEILVVIVLFSAGAVVLLQIFSIGLFGGLENENTLIATALVQDKLESIRNTPYNSIVDEDKAPVTDYPFFQREVKVTTPQANLKEVMVDIYWTERTGEMKISLVTYASNI
ncbi:MAG: hypothetical protein AMJ78_06655 [Omnitrophica WOR_2 bacterium SM23_29]|nr:MAG: hypothetical protein AMJ78_06655 [Omnitrophica WOR_2 bacterium SM23_29]